MLKPGFAAVGLVLFLMVVGLVATLAYLGVFRSVAVTEAEEGPFYFVFRELRGNDMSAVGRLTTELDSLLGSAGVLNRKPFDVFQPQGAQAANEIGFVIEEVDFVRLREREPSLICKVIPRQRYMLAVFPFKNRFSFLAGYIKVDPALRAHRARSNYRSAAAFARNDGDTITYLQPIVP